MQTSLPMTGIWRTIRDYILWSYERGTIQYDVMVTLILVFVFFSPYWIDFKDKPVQRNPHSMEVVVVSDAQGGLIFRVDASAVQAKQDAELRAELLKIIAPISGTVDIKKVEAERDKSGRALSYKVWVHKGQ